MIRHIAILAFLIVTLSNCTTQVQSNPPRTATEELLISAAADRAAAKLALDIPCDTKVFVDSGNFEGTDGKYAVASIRSHLLEIGAGLVDDRKHAEVIAEIRSGALSIDRKTFIIGTPQFNIPIPLTTIPFPFPEISLYHMEEQKGVAKFALTGYDAEDGTLITAQKPQYGFSHNTKKTIFFVISWTEGDYLPKDAEENKTPKESSAF